MGAKLPCQAVGDCGRLAKAAEDTLSLRVARSGTKLASTAAMPWQANTCRPRMQAKDRRLLKVFLCFRQPSAILLYLGFWSFASRFDCCSYDFTTLEPYYTTISVSRKSKRIVKLLDNVH